MNRVLKIGVIYLTLMFIIEITPYFIGYLGSFAVEYLGQFIYILVPVLLIALILKVDFKKRFKLKGFKWSTLILLFFLFVAILPLTNFIANLTTFTFGDNPTGIVAYTESLDVNLYQMLFILAITPAICEEFMFRGLLLDRQTPLNIHQMALYNGLLFGLFHVGYDQLFYTFALGTIFAYVVMITDSLLTGILLHFLNNGFGFILQIILGQHVALGSQQKLYLKATTSTPSMLSQLFAALIGLVVVVLILKKLAKIYNYSDESRWASEQVTFTLYDAQPKLLTYTPALMMMGYVLYRNLF